MADTHTEAVINKFSDQELVQLVPNMGTKVSAMTNKDLLVCFQKWEVEITVFININSKNWK